MRGQRAFAIVLLSPEDIGGAAAPSVVDPQRHRARQNVVLELGWFVGKLGRSRVCALKKGEVELPSDIAGVAYVDMDERGAWKSKLLKELANAL
jgi:predicted nucleotide-binding protein